MKMNTFKESEVETSKTKSLEDKYLILAEIGNLKEETSRCSMELKNLNERVQVINDTVVHVSQGNEDIKRLLVQMLIETNKPWRQRRTKNRKTDLIFQRFCRRKNWNYNKSRRRYKSNRRVPTYSSTKSVFSALSDKSEESNVISESITQRCGSIKIEDHIKTTNEVPFSLDFFAQSDMHNTPVKEVYISVDATNTVEYTTKCKGDMKNATSTTQCVFIKDFKGKCFEIELHCCTTTIDIKNKLQRKTGVPVGSQKLIYGGLVLHDHVSLVSYGIQDRSYVYLTFQQDENRIPKLVWIRHVSNGLISLTEIYTHQNVIDLKLWIRQHAGVPPHRGINMFFNDTQLNNDDEFEDIGIEAKDTIDWDDFPLH